MSAKVRPLFLFSNTRKGVYVGSPLTAQKQLTVCGDGYIQPNKKHKLP